MNRLLIEEDEKNLGNILRAFGALKPLLSSVKSAYEALGNEFSRDVWERVRSGEIAEMKEAYLRGIHEELDASGIRNRALRANALVGIERPFQEFEQAIERLMAHEPYKAYLQSGRLELKNISFRNGEFLITEEDAETIREAYCRVYLDTNDSEAVALWEDAKKLAEIAGRLYEKAEKAKLGVPLNWNSLLGLSTFVTGERTEWKPNIRTVNFIAKNLRKQQEKQ